MGKTIRYENRKDFTISAVYEFPENASERFDYLINWHAFLEDNNWAKDWGNNDPGHLSLLKPGTDPVAFEKKITRFLDNYNKDQGKGFRVELESSFLKTGTCMQIFHQRVKLKEDASSM